MALTKNISFWIVLFFLLRLYGITNPPLEVAHNWRQSDVAMVARNFSETDANVFYPRIDIAGERTGITGMEFPLFNYLIYMVSCGFDYQHWYGRLINLLVSSLGLFFFSKLLAKYFEKQIAFNATLILMFSLWFMYSRKIMPDTFSVSLLIMGIYFGSNYLDAGQKIKDLVLYLFLIMLGLLSKLPAATIMMVLPLLLLDSRISRNAKIIFSATTIIILIIPGLWYFYWVPYLLEKYGFWHYFMGKNPVQGLFELASELPLTLEQFYSNAFKFVGFVVFLFGLGHAVYYKKKRILAIFGLSLLGFFLIMIKSGSTFVHHSYYMIPFVPVMALLCAYGLDQIKNKKFAIILLITICFEGLANQQHDFRIHKAYKPLLKLEKELDNISNRSDLFLVNSAMVPTPMYFAHRKGWVDSNEKISDTVYIHHLKDLGLKYILILKSGFGSEITLPYPIVFQNGDYMVYSVKENHTKKTGL